MTAGDVGSNPTVPKYYGPPIVRKEHSLWEEHLLSYYVTYSVTAASEFGKFTCFIAYVLTTTLGTQLFMNQLNLPGFVDMECLCITKNSTKTYPLFKRHCTNNIETESICYKVKI